MSSDVVTFGIARRSLSAYQIHPDRPRSLSHAAAFPGAKASGRRGGRGGGRSQVQVHQLEDRQVARRGQVESRPERRLRSPPGRENGTSGTTSGDAAGFRETQNATQESGKHGTVGSVAATVEGLSGAEDAVTRGSSAKKTKVDEQKVMWSSGSKRARGTASLAAEGTGDKKSMTRPSLLSLANSFKETFGEGVADDADDSDGADKVEQPPKTRPRTRSRAAVGGSVSEVAAIMSPEKLAAEVQKAKARAREERFVAAGGVKPQGSSTSAVPGPPAKPMSLDGRGGREPKEGERRAGGSGDKLSREASNQGRTSSAASKIDDGGGAGEQSTVIPDTAKPAPRSLSGTSVTEAAAAPHASEPKRSSTRACREDLAAAKQILPAEISAASRGRDSGGFTSEEYVADGKDSERHKVHTLRLQARPATGDDPGHAEGVESLRVDEDPGVEECKGFEPPNLPTRSPQSTSTSESVKPASVSEPLSGSSASTSPASGHAARSLPGVSTSETATVPSNQTPCATKTPASAGGETQEDGDSSIAMSSSRRSSWGPSFSIARSASKSPAGSPRDSASMPENPWVLSSAAPTFAKNRGRPLATAFSDNGAPRERPTKLARTGTAPAALGSSHSGAGANGTRAQSSVGSNPGAVRSSDGEARTDGALGVGADDFQGASRARISGAGPVEGEITNGDLIIEWDGGVLTGITQAALIDVPPHGEDTVDGVKVTGVAKELMERLRREREESLDLERKLTQALLDL